MSQSFEVPFNLAAQYIKAAFGQSASSKGTVRVSVREKYNVADYWDGGSRSECRFLRLADMQALSSEALPQSARQVAGNPFNLACGTIDITPGFIVVEHVIFRGKDLGYRLYMHGENVIPQLSAPAPTDIDERDKKILACFRGLKSGPYRNSALEALSFTTADKERLAEKGYLKVNKVGTQITQEGRAACGDTQTY